ncbi:MAG TPA: DUF11 domain-containing protein [Candidatus Methanoperedens sp.]|nr:DUF11 domain-containing protein [Candidatus Methanoperedens sp.]
MRLIFSILAVMIVVLFTVESAIADDCETIENQEICWEDIASTTLGWTYPQVTQGGYIIEVRDFDWLGSISMRVSKNGIVKEVVLTEGESYLFDFSNDSAFEGIEIIADQVSNINSFPSNIGTFPKDPQAKISFKLSIPDGKKKPTLELEVSTERKIDNDFVLTAYINTQNSGESDLVDTQVWILFDGLEIINEFDFEKGSMNELTSSDYEIKWENISSYKLTPTNPGIIKNGYIINVINFLNEKARINISYNGYIKSDELVEGGSVVFGFTRENEYTGIRILGTHISNDTAELILQYPKKNSVKQRYPIIIAGSSESIKLGFQIPLSSRKTYTISAISTAKDSQGNNYTQSVSTKISLKDTFKINKITSDSILGKSLYSKYSRAGDIATIKNRTYVMIRVDNLANYPVHNVKLTDTILPGFEEDGNRTSMSWNFDMNARDHKEFTYTIIAKRQGVYNLPRAELTWNEFQEDLSLESNSPRTIVSGPHIVMERSFNKSNINIGDTLLASLSITNNGDMPINIIVNDSVPQNTTFLSGTLSFSGLLRPSESARIVYAITANDTVIEFQAPEMRSNHQGFEWYEPLPSKKISGYSPVPAATPTIIPAETAKMPEQGMVRMVDEGFPWLEGAISIITLVSGIFLLMMLNKKKYFRTNEK